STPAETEAAQRWVQFAHSEARIKSFWASHIGPRGEEGQQFHIVELDERLNKEQGDTVNTTLVMDLTSDGVSGAASTNLEGSEESPSRFSDSVLIGWLRNAIRSDRLSRQRAHHELQAEMADKLAYWGERVLLDKWIFRKLSGTSQTDKNNAVVGEAAAANSNIIYANNKTAVAEIEVGDEFTMDLTRQAKVAAMVGSLKGTTIYRIKPYRIDGQFYYLYVDRPEVRYAMRKSATWEENQRLARERALANPIFSGADGIDDGVIFKFHDLVVTATNGGAAGNVAYSNGLFLGTQAGTLYPAQEFPDWIEKTFEYSKFFGIATGMIQGFDKLRYNSIDFAVIAIRSAIPANL
ncbi:MAG: DUF4043 family protein, partial [bacterium]